VKVDIELAILVRRQRDLLHQRTQDPRRFGPVVLAALIERAETASETRISDLSFVRRDPCGASVAAAE
jgi:hypothetical protein